MKNITLGLRRPALLRFPGALAQAGTAPSRLTLIVNPTGAAAGFDSLRRVCSREPCRLDHCAHSESVDPPACMLGSQTETGKTAGWG